MRLTVVQLERGWVPPVIELRPRQNVQLDGMRRTRDTQEEICDEQFRVGVERLVDDDEHVNVAAR